MRVVIQIVTRNSIRYIGNCLESLEQQSFGDFSVMVMDNGSSDGTPEFIRSTFPTVMLLQNFKNIGFGQAHNKGFQLGQGEYVLLLNPDVMLAEDFLTTLVAFADKHPEVGSFGGKLLRLKSEAINQDDQVELRDVLKTDIIDSTGLKITRGRKISDRGAGEKDTGQFDSDQEVFGISGACVLYRTRALEDAKFGKHVFDPDFFAYKEDVDLAWRLRLFGWASWYVPAAVGYHHRNFASHLPSGTKIGLSSRRRVSKLLRAESFKNHQLLLIKNEHALNVWLGLPWLLARELGVFGYSLFTEPFQWKTLGNLFGQIPKAWRQRREIKRRRKAEPRDIRKWMSV